MTQPDGTKFSFSFSNEFFKKPSKPEQTFRTVEMTDKLNLESEAEAVANAVPGNLDVEYDAELVTEDGDLFSLAPFDWRRSLRRVFRLLVVAWIVVVLNVVAVVQFALRPLTALLSPLLVGRTKELVLRTPKERFDGLEELGYGFAENFVSLKIGGGVTLPRMHYVDERPDGRSNGTILCLHGEPTWSFLYRKMIPVFLGAGFRVVAPDFIGFGKSDKYTHEVNYTHEMHTMSLRLFIEELDLRDITLVCQDWGGLTGLSVVKDMPERFSRLVVMNTFLPIGMPHDSTFIKRRGALFGNLAFLLWMSGVRCLGRWLPVKALFKMAGCHEKAIRGYTAPFPSAAHKAGLAQWPLLVPVFSSMATSPHMRAAREHLSSHPKWKRKNSTLIIFSTKDPITAGYDDLFHEFVQGSKKLPLVENAGHFLQEDRGEFIAQLIVENLEKID